MVYINRDHLLLFNMQELTQYITRDNIIFYLCRIRAKYAKNKNKEHLIHLISSNEKYNYHIREDENEVLKFFPSRKKWKKLGINNRIRNGKKLNSIEKNIQSLLITIKWYEKNEPNANFLIQLNDFIDDVQASVYNKDYKIETPETYPKVKGDKNNIENICRPISLFKLKDRIIISLINKYFTDLFDDFFYSNSMAFRAVKQIENKKINITHHDAIKEIIDYKNKINSKHIWVSECDMKKFYDTVNHTQIKKYFRRFINKVKKNHPEYYNENAERIFYSYLDSYTFNKCVYPLNENQEYFRKHHITNGKFEWVEDDLLNGYYKRLGNTKIGVPQGGALSGLIANIVLHYSDTKVNKYKDDSLLYIRYCDDMIIMHTNKQKCKKITETYTNSLKSLKLIPHEFKKIKKYDKSFWKSKSKDVYKWTFYNNNKNVPWIGFVGYEINYDGRVRIRKSSLKKEMTKQVKVINEAYKAIGNNNKRASNKYIEESIGHRLIGMSVGRISMRNYENGINDLCWINGFTQINDNSTLITQLKRLDRNRNKYFKRFKHKITEIEMDDEKEISFESNRQIVYYGKPFSYYYQAIEKKRNKAQNANNVYKSLGDK